MENEKFENQENFDNEIEEISGGKSVIHVSTTNDKENPAKMDCIYLSLRDAFNLSMVKAIDWKNDRIDISQKLDRDDGQRLLNKIITKSKLTTRKKKPWELRFKLYDSNKEN